MSSTAALAYTRDSVKSGIVEQSTDVDPAAGLFGVLTRPEKVCRETGFIFLNSGLLHRVGPFRLYVDIARRIAESGFPSIRLDQSGKGDSDAMPGVPLLDATVSNLRAAAAQLEHETGAKKYVIGGLCSGADDALRAGPQLDNLAGLFMFDGYSPKTARYYVCRYGPMLLSTRAWLRRLRSSLDSSQQPDIGNMRNWGPPREMMERYRILVEKNVRILAVYSGCSDNCYSYPSQLTANIGHPRASALVSEIYLPKATHIFHLSAHRYAAVEEFSDWAERSFPDSSTL